MGRPLALVVDRDASARELIASAFEAHEISVIGAGDGTQTMEVLRRQPVRWLVVGPDTPGVDRKGLLAFVAELRPAPVVIVIADGVDGARDAALIDDGAFDVLAPPLSAERVAVAVRRALRHVALLDETRRLREELRRRQGSHGLIWRSASLGRLRERIARLAAGNASLWFHGEEGTGKALAARTLHEQSGRANGPFVVAGSGALERGAEAGRPAPEWGEGAGLLPLLAQAAGGTLLLEGLSGLTESAQGHLLAVLDGAEARSLDVRVLASTRVDPESLLERGRLLGALAGRLAVDSIGLPPLRERREDIALLADHFLGEICAINHLAPYRITREALALLEGYRWPDNVHGLRNALEQAVILSSDGTIRPVDLPEHVRAFASPSSAREQADVAALRPFRDAKREVVESFEHSYLSALMERYAGNVTAAARRAGMLRSALQRLLRKHGLKSAAFRRSRQVPATEESTQPEP